MWIDEFFALGVAYEMYAWITRRVPTLTQLTTSYPLVGILVVGTLSAHLFAHYLKEIK